MPEWMRKLTGRNKKETMLIDLLCGILLFVIFLPTKSSEEAKNNSSYENEIADAQAVSTVNADMSLQEYKELMESELEEFLSGISGVGEVHALIYLNASWEYRVEKDDAISSDSQSEETVYTVDANGQDVPFITSCICPQIEGVAVIAEGADNEEVRVRLVRLIMTLYGLDANKVDVIG